MNTFDFVISFIAFYFQSGANFTILIEKARHRTLIRRPYEAPSSISFSLVHSLYSVHIPCVYHTTITTRSVDVALFCTQHAGAEQTIVHSNLTGRTISLLCYVVCDDIVDDRAAGRGFLISFVWNLFRASADWTTKVPTLLESEKLCSSNLISDQPPFSKYLKGKLSTRFHSPIHVSNFGCFWIWIWIWINTVICNQSPNVNRHQRSQTSEEWVGRSPSLKVWFDLGIIVSPFYDK